MTRKKKRKRSGTLPYPQGRPAPAVSACMMVKNEEKFLPRCLASIRDYVDEIVVVDTGSEDGTVAIAESFGAKIFHHPWENDFSKHRNQSIAYATGEWIFIIDADEELAEGGEKIREAVRDESIDSILITVMSFRHNQTSRTYHNSVRIFRNNGLIRYQGIVHNQLKGYAKSMISPLKIIHYGYDQGEESNEAKFIRTSSLLMKQIEMDPRNPLPYHYLAASYLTVNRYEEALESSSTAIRIADEKGNQDVTYLGTHYMAGAACYATKRFAEGRRYCEKALARFDRHLDSLYMLSLICFEIKDRPDFFRYAEKCLLVAEQIRESPAHFGTIVNENVGNIWKIHLFLGFVCSQDGDEAEARRWYAKAFALCPLVWKCHKAIGLFYLSEGNYDLAERHVEIALAECPGDADLLHAGAAICKRTGREKERKAYLELLFAEKPKQGEIACELAMAELRGGRYLQAISLLEKVRGEKPHLAEVCVNLGLAYAMAGRSGDSLKAYEDALAINPSSLEGLTNMGHLYFRLMEYTKAKEVFRKAIEIDKSLADVHLAMGMIYLLEADYENLVGVCDAVLSILGLSQNCTLDSVSDLSHLFRLIGETLMAEGRPRIALFAFRIAAKLLESAENYGNLAQAHIAVGECKHAVEDLEKAVMLRPDNGESFVLLGRCYEDLGVGDAAALCFDKAAEIDSRGGKGALMPNFSSPL